MSMSELMSGMGLTFWPQVALAIFLGVFVLVIGRGMRRYAGDAGRAAASMALEDESACQGAGTAQKGSDA